MVIVLVVACLLALAHGQPAASSPRKFFAYSLSNTRGPNLIRGYSFHYVSCPVVSFFLFFFFFSFLSSLGNSELTLLLQNQSLIELPGFPVETGGA